MFETLSHLALQQYWWAIVSLLGALLVFLMFVQGGQTLLYTIAKNEVQRTMLVNSLGRKWEFTFTTLVTFGGAFFASFPLFYSTSFGGAYWVWMAILFAFVIQAVSYEYRTKPDNFLGQKTFEIFLFVNGALGTILIGTAVGTFFTGSPFSVNLMNMTNVESGSLVISEWVGPAYGLEAVLNIQNVALGLAVFFLARVLGVLYFMNTIDHTEMRQRMRKSLIYNAAPFLVFFLFFVIRLMFLTGFGVDPETKEVFLEANKYWHNLIQMPLNTLIFLVGVVGVLWGIISSVLKDNSKGIWFAGTGTVLVVFSLFLMAGYNHTAYYPAYPWDTAIANDPALLKEFLQSSLTIENSSSSHFTLTTMSYVSLLVPFVLAYIFYAWRSLNDKQITEEEMESSTHKY